MAPSVSETAGAEKPAPVGEHVADDDPLDRRYVQSEARGDRRKADVDRAIERAEQCAQTSEDDGVSDQR